jgi:tetratricopeptide (TPR) repeat protein
MKNQLYIYIIIINALAFNSWAQEKPSNATKTEEILRNPPKLKDKADLHVRKVKHYCVEEISDSKFGGHVTVYYLTQLSLIQTNDLGPHGKRIITTVFENGEKLVETILQSDGLKKTKNSDEISITDLLKQGDATNPDTEKKKIETPDFSKKKKIDGTTIPSNNLNKLENTTEFSISDAPKKLNIPANIDIIKTYERVVEKGYVTLDILKKLANSYFFDNQLLKAEKYYTKLFDLTTDLEPEYYYRYATSLKATGQVEKANEYLKIFNQLSGNNIR